MSERWATIIKSDDGKEVISSIAQMEGMPPEIRDDQQKNTRVQRVADGVKIGMVRGGPVDTIAGWGFPEGTQPTSAPATKFTPSNPDEKSRVAVKEPVQRVAGSTNTAEQEAAQVAQRKADAKAQADAKAAADHRAKAKT